MAKTPVAPKPKPTRTQRIVAFASIVLLVLSLHVAFAVAAAFG